MRPAMSAIRESGYGISHDAETVSAAPARDRTAKAGRAKQVPEHDDRKIHSTGVYDLGRRRPSLRGARLPQAACLTPGAQCDSGPGARRARRCARLGASQNYQAPVSCAAAARLSHHQERRPNHAPRHSPPIILGTKNRLPELETSPRQLALRVPQHPHIKRGAAAPPRSLALSQTFPMQHGVETCHFFLGRNPKPYRVFQPKQQH